MSRSALNPASFCPPTLPEPAAASRPPAWVLLEKKAYIAKRENATTATGTSSGGDTLEVSFCLADPPAISYLCVHCPGREDRLYGAFSCEPIVARGEGAFVLVQVSFNFGPRDFIYYSGIVDYFVYRAGPGEPSLRRLADPYPRDIKPWQVGILPSGGDGKGFVVAALIPQLWVKNPRQFDLHLFSSRTWKWNTVVPQLDPSCEHNDKFLSHVTSKVIMVGEGFLGWVDLWRGILLCDVLAEKPKVRFIPLPKPMVAKVWKSNPGVVRDVTSSNNCLDFVEIQFPKGPDDDLPPSYFDISISDSDTDDESMHTTRSPISDGWRATTWKMMLSSKDWRKDCTVDSGDILAGNPTCFHLLPELWDAEAGKLTLNNLDSSAPVIIIHDDGVVYMMSEVKGTNGTEAWVSAFDVRKKTLKALAPFSDERIFTFDNTCLPCSFSTYLGMTTGEETANSSTKYIAREKLQPFKFFGLVLMSARDQLSKFGWEKNSPEKHTSI